MPPDKSKKLEQSKADDSFSNNSSSSSAESECPLKKKKKPPKKPCHLYKLTVTEKWPSPPKQPEPAKPETDQTALEKKIADKMSEIDQAQMKLDNTYNVTRARVVRSNLLSLQDELLELIRKRCEIGPDVVVWKPPEGERVFTIVKEIPKSFEKQIAQGDAKTRTLKEALLKLLQDWHRCHKDFEDSKVEQNLYDKQAQALAKARDKARMELEKARILVDIAKDVVAQKSIAPPTSLAVRFWEGFKSLVGVDAQSKLTSAQSAYQEAKKTHTAAVNAYNDYKTGAAYKRVVKRVKDTRTALIKKTVEIREKSDQLTKHEKTYLEMRNTLVSGGDPIQMVAGEEKRRWKDWDMLGKATHDRTPDVTVEIDVDNKPEGPKSKEYCSDEAPYRGVAGPHPYLLIKGGSGFSDEPIIAETTGGKKAEFKIWQAPQLDWPARGPIVLALFFKTLRGLFSGWPFHRTYNIRAESCGWDPDGKPVTQNVEIALDVIPQDSYVFTMKTNAFAGFGMESSYKSQTANEPDAQTGLLQYESSGSVKEVTRTDSVNAQIGFGMVSHSWSNSHVTGYNAEGAKEKDIAVHEETSKVFNKVTTTTGASGEFQGKEYSADRTIHRTYDASGANWEDTFDVKETGNIASRTNPDGSIKDQDAYQKDQSFAEQTYSAKGASLSRIPAPPSSLFPFVPVDISMQRNGYEDDFMATIKGAISLIIWISRQAVMYVSRLDQMVPSLGWKVGFNVDILSGTFSYEHAFREHLDRRVWHYHKGNVDIKILSGKIYLFGGFWWDFFGLEFKIGAEINGFGSFGIQGMVENNHPDAIVDTNISFGSTGAFGFGIEIKVVVGNADWCSATAACTAGFSVKGTSWVKHQDGPHKDLDISFDGIIGTVSVNIVLVGNYQRKKAFVNPRNLYTGIWPKPTEDDLLERQNKEMEEERVAAAEEALELEKQIAQRKKK